MCFPGTGILRYYQSPVTDNYSVFCLRAIRAEHRGQLCLALRGDIVEVTYVRRIRAPTVADREDQGETVYTNFQGKYRRRPMLTDGLEVVSQIQNGL